VITHAIADAIIEGKAGRIDVQMASDGEEDDAAASYKKDYAVTGVTPLKNLTNWTLNGTTWLKDSTIGLLINKSKIQNDLQASSSPEITLVIG